MLGSAEDAVEVATRVAERTGAGEAAGVIPDGAPKRDFPLVPTRGVGGEA